MWLRRALRATKPRPEEKPIRLSFRPAMAILLWLLSPPPTAASKTVLLEGVVASGVGKVVLASELRCQPDVPTAEERLAIALLAGIGQGLPVATSLAPLKPMMTAQAWQGLMVAHGMAECFPPLSLTPAEVAAFYQRGLSASSEALPPRVCVLAITIWAGSRASHRAWQRRLAHSPSLSEEQIRKLLVRMRRRHPSDRVEEQWLRTSLMGHWVPLDAIPEGLDQLFGGALSAGFPFPGMVSAPLVSPDTEARPWIKIWIIKQVAPSAKLSLATDYAIIENMARASRQAAQLQAWLAKEKAFLYFYPSRV